MTAIKLLIFSDSHGKTGAMLEIVEKEKPDEIIHLGDCLRDAETISFVFPDLPVTMVPGNCDGWTNRRDSLLLERQGVKLLLAHGHQWHVKETSVLALREARAQGADVLLYGHTHRAVCRQEGSVLVLNPGTVGGIGASASYGVVEIGDAGAAGRIIPVS